jgi:hypothetical protein
VLKVSLPLQAVRDGVTWLLHIDADELFHCPESRSVVEHFRELSRDGVTVSDASHTFNLSYDYSLIMSIYIVSHV